MYRSVLDWLDETSGKYAEKTAFTDIENRLTFAEFNRITKSVGSRLARELLPSQPVIVMTGRHVYTPTCFLGVVRAGCFYAPVDVTMPVPRLNQILGIIKSKAMIVDKKNLEMAKKLDFDGKVYVMEEMVDAPIDESLLESAEKTLHEFSPLYVIFTSGSMGVPKGVITSHNSLMCYIDAIRKVLDICEDDTFGNQSPLDYIAAVRDIYLPIRTGASSVILPKNKFSVPTQLFDVLDENHVTTLCWSASGLEHLARINAFAHRCPKYVKKVCFSGSVLPGKSLKEWQDHLPEALFVNQYGPTEATASCTYYIVKGGGARRTRFFQSEFHLRTIRLSF